MSDELVVEFEFPEREELEVEFEFAKNGTFDHSQLINRDKADQHPISAITDLQNTLDSKQATIEDLDDIRAGAEAGATAVQPEELAPVATSGSYDDLTDKPTIPTVNNATLTIQKNGVNVQTFTANSATDKIANIIVPTKTSDITNNSGYITGITSTDVTTALGYTPYDSSNPNGYTSNTGTVTSVNNTSPDGNGNVTISIPAAQVQSNWTESDNTKVDYIKNKPTLSTVATSGSYNDLSNKPTIPTVNNATLTIQKNGTTVNTFTANSSSDVTANITVPTDTSDLTNNAGYITGITSSDVTTALGYTPYNSTNPSGYQENVIETVKVNGTALTPTDKAVNVTVPTTVADIATETQLNAINSGATSTNIGQITTNANDISDIKDLIPSQASDSNQLADKEFVNSSIATNTANFIGTFENLTTLEAYSGTITNNDYAFVINSVVTDNGNDWSTFSALDNYSKTSLTNFDYAWVVNGSKFDLYRFDIVEQEWALRVSDTNKEDVTLNTAYNRYKAVVSGNTTTWIYEYTLNNSSFTAAQWAAINSGITSGDVALIATALQPNDNISQLTNDAGYTTNTGTVTSVQIQATSPVQSSTSTAQTTTASTTISLADGYGDTKNPYASKTANYVLAAPNGSNGTPSFRALVKADIPLASETAAQGGTTTSLVTTGEKYTWNNKQNALSTQTAYTSKGTATKVPQITTNSLGQVTGITEVDITYPTEIPSQTGQSGKYLTTNGSNLSWSDVDSLPSQTGNSGKFLTTNGTTASWATVSSSLSGLSDVTLTNPSSGQILSYDGSKWVNESIPNWTISTFTNNSGSTLNTQVSLNNSVMVFKNGVLLTLTEDYTISGTTITFVTALESSDNVTLLKSDINVTTNKILTFTNVTASTWVSDSTYTGYDYKCDITCTGVTANMFAQVSFAPAQADTGNYATVCSTSTNTITIYSKVNTSITIPTIMVTEVA